MKVNELMRAMARFLVEEDPEVQRRLRQVLADWLMEDERCVTEEDAAKAVLMEVGVSAHLSGHRYLVAALALVARKPELMDRSLVKGVYGAVAEQMGTTASIVERGMRHAIEATWDRCDPEALYAWFGNSVSPDKGRPTVGQFLGRMAEEVRGRVGT
jgi:hypothetical protein